MLVLVDFLLFNGLLLVLLLMPLRLTVVLVVVVVVVLLPIPLLHGVFPPPHGVPLLRSRPHLHTHSVYSKAEIPSSS